MSKFCPSTRFCAPSMALVSQGCSIGSFSWTPKVSISFAMRSEAKIRIRSSSSDR